MMVLKGRALQARLAVLFTAALLSFPACRKEQAGQGGQSALGQWRRLIPAVARLRRIKVRRPIRMAIRSRAHIRRYIQERIRLKIKPAEVKAIEGALKHFGLIPKTMDYQAFLVKLYTEQIAGYYDAHRKVLFIADWIPKGLQKPVLAHEIVHAIQDQYMDLKTFLDLSPSESDRMLALGAFIEGEALALQINFMLLGQNRDFLNAHGFVGRLRAAIKHPPRHLLFGRAPEFIQRTFTFPYLYGLEFIAALKKRMSWPGITRLYNRLPSTTEQILHPEKYLNGEKSTSLSPVLAPRQAAGLKKMFTLTMGEYQIGLLLAQYLPAGPAAAAAAGWDGDRMILYTGKKRLTLTWATSWDSEADARQFAQAYIMMARKRFNNIKALKPGYWWTASGLLVLKREGSLVVIAEGLGRDALESTALLTIEKCGANRSKCRNN